MRFDDRVAIITGAARGLGRAYALALASRGAKVALIDIGCSPSGDGESDNSLQEVAEMVNRLGGEALSFVLDVAEEMDIESAISFVMEQWGRIDLMVCSAGYQQHKSLEDTQFSEWKRMFSVEVDSVFHMATRLWPIFKKQQHGRIIVTTSATGFFGEEDHCSHGAAKMALFGLVNSLAKEGAEHNIHVNSICPVAKTRQTERHYENSLLDKARPQSVTPGLLFLAGSKAPNGKHLMAAGNHFSVVRVHENRGHTFDEDEMNPENLLRLWPSIKQSAILRQYYSRKEYLLELTERLKKAAKQSFFS
ncbi:SDR family NAD(P)-dependent oxidoreductase [Paraferrimonas haliotis]|uniref:Short-chain dehydrogenase/reductase n=1 Tax=Paraferrimonas haliotis TaxID=2013866 RepID=A0AA37WZY7_9GAMM|nr:SDR family NAD(P)-dependent oxidoreductase [Paraferrimonas haliotis]GLS84321.1 short-chain dehydrogenase/reductase [Paraferrimonas haliotis]